MSPSSASPKFPLVQEEHHSDFMTPQRTGFPELHLVVSVLCLFAWGTQNDPKMGAASEHPKKCGAVAFSLICD